jgi:phosphoribosylanthranilate isomerase
MLSILKVKICGLREPENIRAVGVYRPDFMGFIFVSDSPRSVERVSRAAILAGVPAGVERVGVFRNASHGEVVKRVEEWGLDGVQLHGEEDGAYLRELRRMLPTQRILRAVSIRSERDIEALNVEKRVVDCVVLDGPSAGSGESFEWGWIERYPLDIPFFLAGGVGPESMQQVLELKGKVPLLAGIDCNSRVEITPGVKDPEKVRKVIESVRL